MSNQVNTGFFPVSIIAMSKYTINLVYVFAHLHMKFHVLKRSMQQQQSYAECESQQNAECR